MTGAGTWVGVWRALVAALALAGCSVQGSVGPDPATGLATALPAMKSFGASRAPAVTRSNASIAQDFMSLSFLLESGREIPVLARFEGPVTVRMTGAASPRAGRDLDLLLARLRAEANVPISRVPAGDTTAAITIEILPRNVLQNAVPLAACFVAPNVSGWREYRSRRNSDDLDWTRLTTRTRMAIFIPANVSPQEVRDCLHEELAQSLGPVNDLYHLTDSVFNDDNFHTVLTGFDMMVLRVFYDPALHSGMTTDAVAARVPAILDRINPRGRRAGSPRVAPGPVNPTTRNWINAIEAALGPGVAPRARLRYAQTATRIARSNGWNDNRLGFSLYALGRLALGSDIGLALASFSEADALFRASPDTRLHAAHVAVQGAAYALSAGRPGDAVAIVDANAPVALAAENARLLATLLMLKAQGLMALGQARQAEIVRLDSLGWARYGFGSDGEIRRRLAEISALTPAAERIAAR